MPLDSARDLLIEIFYRLSEDLNWVPTHFVLECLQNVEDNDYPRGAAPFLQISINAERILLNCNEIGFKEAHVKAICSVGQSTKPSRQDYIDEKALGLSRFFKMPRRFTSNRIRFIFKFDKGQELVMITPIWISEEDAIYTPNEEFQTAILLLPPAGETYAEFFLDSTKFHQLFFYSCVN
jgi:hypothetical protein